MWTSTRQLVSDYLSKIAEKDQDNMCKVRATFTMTMTIDYRHA